MNEVQGFWNFSGLASTNVRAKSMNISNNAETRHSETPPLFFYLKDLCSVKPVDRIGLSG